MTSWHILFLCPSNLVFCLALIYVYLLNLTLIGWESACDCYNTNVKNNYRYRGTLDWKIPGTREALNLGPMVFIILLVRSHVNIMPHNSQCYTNILGIIITKLVIFSSVYCTYGIVTYCLWRLIKTRILRFSAYALAILTEYPCTAWAAFGEISRGEVEITCNYSTIYCIWNLVWRTLVPSLLMQKISNRRRILSTGILTP